jgi:excisionase family DNA binding protein
MSTDVQTVNQRAVQLLRDAELTMPVPAAAKVLQISKSHAYDLIARGEWPTRVHRLGRAVRIPTADLARYVGVDL